MYNKLFTKILDSSIWLEPTPTRIVWLTFIAVMDEQGFVQFASIANVAHRARVTLDEATAAITCLEGPDGLPGEQEHEGRRIERVPDGWMVLNSVKYRSMVTKAVIQEQVRERVKRHRAKASVTSNDAALPPLNVTPSEAIARAGTRAKAKNTDAPAAPDATAFTFPVVGTEGPTWVLTVERIDDWSRLYPQLDLNAESSKALAWVQADPHRRKTARGMPRFLVGWFNRAVDRPSNGNHATPAGRLPTAELSAQSSASACSHVPPCPNAAIHGYVLHACAPNWEELKARQSGTP